MNETLRKVGEKSYEIHYTFLWFDMFQMYSFYLPLKASEARQVILSFFKILFIFRERGREGERETSINVWLPLKHSLLGTYSVYNRGMCPDWESNRQPFGSQAGAQSTELHQPGLDSEFSIATT